MFSGLQELLLIAVIIGLLFMLPRLMQRGRGDNAGASAAAGPRLSLSRGLRLAVVLSAIWLLVSVGYFQPWKHSASRFLYVGIVPLAAVWGLIWIAHGRRGRRRD